VDRGQRHDGSGRAEGQEGLPGSFDVAGDALRVIVPPGFTDVDDDIPEKGTR
jgi:hypothetical protein